jgi:hypothetical protein
MNTTGEGEEHPYSERLTPELPLSAPVMADVLPDHTVGHYAEYPPEPVPPAPEFLGDARPGDDRPAPDVAGGPPAVQFARHSAPGPPDPRPASDPEPAGEQAGGWGAAPPAREGGRRGRRGTGHDYTPDPPPQPGYLITGGQDGPPEDPTRVILRKHLDALRVRAANASSWLETSVHYARIVNRDGVVPVTARFTRDDIEFLGRAREEVLGFAELGLRLLELHAPLDAGGISTDPSSPILRCRSCMWRWPCPTFRMLTDAVSQLPRPGSPGR